MTEATARRRGRGRPPKTLLELIRDDSFRRDRHAGLLLRETLPEAGPAWAPAELWDKLLWAQRQHRKYHHQMLAAKIGTSERSRASSMEWEFVNAFSRGVRALHGGRLPWLLGSD